MLTQLGRVFILVSLFIVSGINVAYSAPKSDSLELWKGDLPYQSPLIEKNETKITDLHGKFVLTTMIQIEKKKEGETHKPPPPPDFFINLFLRHGTGENSYTVSNYQVIHDKTNWIFDPQFSPDGTKVLFLASSASVWAHMESASIGVLDIIQKICNSKGNVQAIYV